MKKALAAAIATFGMATAIAGGPDMPAPPMVEWYLGAGVTMNSIENVELNINNTLISGLLNTNLAVGNGYDWCAGWNVFVGADIGKHWGVEANYSRVGDIKFTPSLTVAGGTGSASWKAKEQYGYLAALFRQTLLGPMYFVAKLGWGFGQTEYGLSVNVPGFANGSLACPKINHFGLVYGAGFGAKWGQFGIRTMFTRLDVKNVFDISSVDLSAMWYFAS